MNNKLLLVGWDGAEPAIVGELLRAGRLPNLARLIASGGRADLLGGRPPLSPTAWTTLVTGKRPEAHRVLGAMELDDEQTVARTASAYGRRAAALWEIVEAAGGMAHAVNFPAMLPPGDLGGASDERRGLLISDSAFEWNAMGPGELPFPAELRVQAGAVDLGAVSEFMPAVRQQSGLAGDSRVHLLRTQLATTASAHAVMTWAMDARPEWKLAAVVYPGIELVSRAFMRYRGPDVGGDGGPEAHAAFGAVVDAMYAFHDAMLGRLMELAGEETSVLLVSDHGYAWGADRLVRGDLDDEAWSRAQHRRAGVVAWGGPGFAGGELDHATVLDVVPTALAALGLPAGRDMPGRVWDVVGVREGGGNSAGEMASGPKAHEGVTARIPSWEARVVRPSEPASASWLAAEHLLALGYRDVPAPPGSTEVLRVQARRQFALAEAYVDGGMYDVAVTAMRPLVAQDPLRVEYSALMFEALYRGGRFPEAWQLVSALRARGARGPLLELGTAMVELQRRKPAEALARLQVAEADMPASADLREIQGEAYLALNDFGAARDSFGKAAILDPASDRARVGLSKAALGLGDLEAALLHALEAVERRVGSAAAHCQVGVTLARMKRGGEAELALRQALAIDADCDPAAEGLARLYREVLGRPEDASEVEREQRERVLRRRHFTARKPEHAK